MSDEARIITHHFNLSSPNMSSSIVGNIDCNATGVDNYQQGTQIAGVFIVFALSVAGASLPVSGAKQPNACMSRLAHPLNHHCPTDCHAKNENLLCQ